MDALLFISFTAIILAINDRTTADYTEWTTKAVEFL